ncbi:MAG: NACHT domain-containing protein [Cyanobacteria bacterium P01_G01_bin.39]
MQLCPEGKQLIEHALTKRAWTLEEFEDKSDYCISTIKKFSSGKNVHRVTFVKLCELLDVNWEIASGKDRPSEHNSTSFAIQEDDLYSKTQTNNSDNRPSIDNSLIERVTEHCRQKILKQHSWMRLLNGTFAETEKLYVDVYLLERPEKNHYKFIESYQQYYDFEKDRYGLGKRLGERKLGTDLINQDNNLIILGKPGSGKTTFLKHLAIYWCKNKLKTQKIAVFLELRRITDEKWILLEAIDRELGLNNWEEYSKLSTLIQILREKIEQVERKINNIEDTKFSREKQKRKSAKRQQYIYQINDIKSSLSKAEKKLSSLPLEYFLKNGKILIFMDGFDEISIEKLRSKVYNQINIFSQKYIENRIFLTCRTQIIDNNLSNFIPVEIAEFTAKQVEEFVKNWLSTNTISTTKNIRQSLNYFNNTVMKIPQLKSLTESPILLSLLCIIFQDNENIPLNKLNRNSLYEKGIKQLLGKWNDNKQIHNWEFGDEFYGKLSIDNKEKLLTEIAALKFNNKENFVLFSQKDLVNYINDYLKLNNKKQGLAVLQSIESQHGLLIERANEVWSFSHLTFQEYFTVKWLNELCLEKLTKIILDSHWQLVIKHLVKSQQPADNLINRIKTSIDKMISLESNLQFFLESINQKTINRTQNSNIAAIRAFYFMLSSKNALTVTDFFDYRKLSRNIDLCFESFFHNDNNLQLDQFLFIVLSYAHSLLNNEVDYGYYDALKINLNQSIELAANLDFKNELLELKSKLQELDILIKPKNNFAFINMWQIHGNQWTRKFNQVLIKYRNIACDYHFTDKQWQNLKQYYLATEFIIELINISGAVSQKKQSAIKRSLFLPWNDLEKQHIFLNNKL